MGVINLIPMFHLVVSHKSSSSSSPIIMLLDVFMALYATTYYYTYGRPEEEKVLR